MMTSQLKLKLLENLQKCSEHQIISFVSLYSPDKPNRPLPNIVQMLPEQWVPVLFERVNKALEMQIKLEFITLMEQQ